MGSLGPFERRPALAVAVSGGADSMALALLAREWAAQHGGSVLALVVDHGLRPESAAEARLTIARLGQQQIPARLLPLNGLTRGSAMAERARLARYEALAYACRQSGLLHMLLGHHAGDQAETLAMRALRGSLSPGLSGMAALRETAYVRLLRPLLSMPAPTLRSFLTLRGVEWVEDPSNQDPRALRVRMRHGLASPPGSLADAAVLAGQARAREECDVAQILAERVTLRPEGCALLTPGRIRPEVLGALIRAISGARYRIAPATLATLARQPGPATLGGVRLMAAGRTGDIWVLREEARIAPAQPAHSGMLWDSRFTLKGPVGPDLLISKLGDAAARLRAMSPLPAAALRTLPALWRQGELAAVPILGYSCPRHSCTDLTAIRTIFTPACSLAGPYFTPSSAKD